MTGSTLSISEVWDEILGKSSIAEVPGELLATVREAALTSTKPADISFGTAGWRAVIGDEYTLFNLRRVTRAIIEMYRQDADALRNFLGVASWEEFKERGVLLGHDTRFMAKKFAATVACMLNDEDVRVAYAGTTTTPELSACVPALNFACSINLTPSHNPGNYGGYKFNPADGGGAGPEITDTIETRAAQIRSVPPPSAVEPTWERIDSAAVYTQFVESAGVIDLEFCRQFAHSGSIALAVDTVHGATRNKTCNLLSRPANLTQLRTEEEPFFGGIAPEPSDANMERLTEHLRNRTGALKLGAIMDPDGDRIRFHDGESDISMNQFAVLAFHYLAVHRDRRGGAAKSVASSDFIGAVAAGLGRPLYETKVGFKNFRPHLRPGSAQPAVVAFEEADGFSMFGHTIEKDAQAGFLIALEMIGRTGKSLTAYLKELQAEYGVYCPVRAAFEVDRAMMGAPVRATMQKMLDRFNEGMKLDIGGRERVIARKITLDGLKLVFDDRSWFLIRPSGTEPKIRVYTESSTEEDAQGLFEATKELFQRTGGIA